MKGNLKRLAAACMAVVLVCSLAVFPANAVNTPKVTMKVASAVWSGKRCAVTVTAETADGSAFDSIGGQYTITYDKDILRLASTGDVVSGTLPGNIAMTPFNDTAIDTANANGEITLPYVKFPNNVNSSIPSGQLYATLYFTVKDDSIETTTTQIGIKNLVVNYFDSASQVYSSDLIAVGAPVTTTVPGALPTVGAVTLSPSSGTVNGTSGFTAAAAATSTSTKDITRSVTWSVSPTNGGVSINATTGAITVTPKATAGSYTVTASGKSGASTGSANATLTVSRATPAAAKVEILSGGKAISGSQDIIGIPSTGSYTKSYTAQAYDQYGDPISGATLTQSGSTGSGISFSGGTVSVTNATSDGASVTLRATCGSAPAKTLTVVARKVAVNWDAIKAKTAITYGQTAADAFTTLPAAGTATAYTGSGTVTLSGTFSAASSDLNVGTKTVTVTFTVTSGAGYVGQKFTKDYTVTVNSRSLANATIGAVSGLVYDGTPKTPTPTVRDDLGKTLVAGTDFDFSYGNNTNAGTNTATVTVTGKGNYTGTKTANFTIARAPISLTDAAPTIPAIYASDETNNASAEALAAYVKAQKGTFAGTYGGNSITFDAAWKLTGGTYDRKGGTYTFTATLTPQGAIEGDNFTMPAAPTARVEVKPVTAALTLDTTSKTVAKAQATNVAALGLPTAVQVQYTPAAAGAPATFTIATWDKTDADITGAAGRVNDSHTEETLTLSPRTYTGAPAWVTLGAAPQFTLTITNKYPVKVNVTGVADITYGGTLAAPSAAQVAINDGTDDTAGASFKFTYVGTGDTDYPESETAPTNAGTYKVIATLVSTTHSGKGELAFKINPKDISTGADVTIAAIPAETFNGKAHEPVLTVKDAGIKVDGEDKTLVLDTDYTVAYTNNVNAGPNATVTVTGKGNYTGTKTAAFVINPLGLTAENTTLTGVSASYPYTGSAIDPKVNVAVTGIGTLAVTTDYTLTYSDNTNAGTATITITGTNKADGSETGNYYGSVTKTFEITKAALSGVVTLQHTDADSDGTINAGDTLEAITTKLPDTANVTYQWYRDGKAIDGETGKTYTLTADDTSDSRIHVVVTANGDSNYAGSVTSSSVTVARKPMPTGLSVNIAVTKDGSKINLTATVILGGGTTDVETIVANFGIQWFRNGAAVGNPVAVTASGSALDAVTYNGALAGGDVLTCALVPRADAADNYTGSVPATASTVDAGASGDASGTTGDVKITATPPAAPVVTAIPGNGTVTVRWTPGSANGSTVLQWQVDCQPDGGAKLTQIVDPSTTTATFSGLTNGTVCHIEVRAIISASEGSQGAVGTANATPAVPVSPGGGSGGGSTVVKPGNAVSVKRSSNGTVTSDVDRAKKGDTVTLTVKPNSGYELDTLTVTDKDGKEIRLREGRKDNTFTFTMPDGKVNVEATFRRIETKPVNPFRDVASSSPFYDAILWAYENDITGGTTATTFSPGNACTRAQTVTFLWRAAGRPAPRSTVNPFTDLDTGAYYYEAVLWAVEQGITNGLTATTFAPDATVNRGQVVTFLYRSAKAAPADAGNPFSDVAADAYYTSPVLWAVANGITNGTSATTFAPGNPCTRGQIVTFLYRHYN